MATSSAYFSTADRPGLPPALRHARTIMLVWAAFAGVWAIIATITLAPSADGAGILIGAVLPELIGGVLAWRMERLPRWPLLTITIVQIALAAGDLLYGSVRGIVQLAVPIAVLVLLIRGYRSRTRTPDPYWQAGASFVEYAGLIVLAALILGALVVVIPGPVQQGTRTAICRIFNGTNCGASTQSGTNNPGAPKNNQPGTKNAKTGGTPTKSAGACHGFWGCTGHYTWGAVKQVGGFFVGVGKSLWEMGDGLVTSIAHPTQFITGIGYAISHPGDAAKSIFLGDAEDNWKKGNYGEAIGDVFTNTGSLFIPDVDFVTGLGDAGKIGKLGKLADLAKAGDRAASDAAKAAKDDDVAKAENAAKQADDNAKKAEDQGRKDGCKVAALGGVRPVPLIHLGFRAGVPLDGSCPPEEQNNLNQAEKDKKAADKSVADANLDVGPKDTQAVRDRLAKSGETIKKSRTVGVGGYDIDGVGTGRIDGVSGPSPSRTAPVPDEKTSPFKPEKVDDPTYRRPVDAEYKVLDQLARKIDATGKDPAEVTGRANLYVDKPYNCDACLNVISQFKARYPHVTFKIIPY